MMPAQAGQTILLVVRRNYDALLLQDRALRRTWLPLRAKRGKLATLVLADRKRLQLVGGNQYQVDPRRLN
jgi:hypothetical protein